LKKVRSCEKTGEMPGYRVQSGGAMGKSWFLLCAKAALGSTLALIFVGAIVRVTGAGMGCPDWPKCWGELIPPTKAEQVDFEKLDIAKFQRKAAKMGRDPQTISVESLRAEFNVRHVWTEFINRLFSLPVGLFSLLTFVLSFGKRREAPVLVWSSLAGLILVLLNAWMGARVVYSGLAPGVLTIHMSLAFLLIMVQTFVVWRGSELAASGKSADRQGLWLRRVLVVLFVLTIAEGIMGTQIRELTDSLSKFMSVPREQWGATLENSWVYLLHRSFSWVILGVTIYAAWLSKQMRIGAMGLAEKAVIGIVLAQMVLGVVMSQIHVYGVVQILHVGLAAILIAANFYWILSSARARSW
jgi:heme a synthase